MTIHLNPKGALAAILVLLLAACGSGDTSTPKATPEPVMAATMQKSSGNSAVVSDYFDVVQRVYVAYFGRPADVAGLTFYAQNYMNAGAATNIVDVSNAYGANAQVRALIDSFGTSKESQDLYPGDNSNFVGAIYRNLFNREADTAGLGFWVGNIDAGRMTRAQAAVAIMAGSQGSDATLIGMKVKVARDFTTALNTTTKQSAYSGLSANAVVRTMLGGVTLATDVNSFQSTIDGTIATVVGMMPQDLFLPAFAVIQERCVGCHSQTPRIPGFSPAPLGIKYDTTAQVKADANRINAVVQSGTMPYANMTGMSAEERAIINTWVTGGGQ
jgi:hypothetical protein